MNYRPKVVRCRLKTGGKSIPQIREECRGQGLTYRDFENIQRSNEEFDGLVVLLSLWAYDNHASYHLHNWDPADDERMMMAIYYAEQVHPFPRYKNDLAKFKADWAAQAYDPGGASLTFAPADVEELEVLCEEAAEPEPEPPKVELIPETIVKRQDMRKEFAKFVDDGYLEKTLTSGQRGAYHEIYRHLAARCVPSPSSLRNGLKDEMRLHYLACMNEVIEKYGSLTPLMEAMAHELDFDVFWAKAAKDPNVNNPMGLFYHIIEERALNPIGTIMNDQAQRQKVAAKEKGEKDKWHNESWMDAFEEDIPDDSEE